MFWQRALPQVWSRAHLRSGRCHRSKCAALTTSITTNGASVKRPRVVVAMSGGVDSSVAAHLLQQHQHHQSLLRDEDATAIDSGVGSVRVKSDCDGVVNANVIGLHMSNWNALDEDSNEKSSRKDQSNTSKRKLDADTSNTLNRNSATNFCQASEQEYNDALLVARHLSIPLHRVSFASEYWIQVFEPFVESLSPSRAVIDSEGGHERSDGGMTMTMPNPDFGCNTYIKFGAMKEYALDRLQADYVATGHYARLWHRDHTALYSDRSNNEHAMQRDFYHWMKETSRLLEQSVRESIAGRPEEEWILNNRNSSYSGDTSHDPMLIAGVDRSKDQSYFLSGVKSKAFHNVIFPLGHLAKGSKSIDGPNQHEEDRNSNIHLQQSVRDIARQANIPTASKKDSMGICFIGKRNFGEFVSQYLPEPIASGNFIDIDTGEIIGKHEGSMHYTIGQGAKISGANVRYFVCGIGGNNTVFVCNDTHHPALYTDELYVDFVSFNWIGLGGRAHDDDACNNIPLPLMEGQSIKLFARTRHLQPLVSCTVTWERHGRDGRAHGNLLVNFDKPMRAITPGQIVALYAGKDGLICLGGGPIKGKGASFMDQGVDISLSSLHPSGNNDLSLSSFRS